MTNDGQMTTPGGKPPQSIRHLSLVIYHWSFRVRVPLSLLSLKEPPNRLAGFRVVLAVVQTEEAAQCGGRLVLVDGLGTGPFPPELALGTDEGHPDVTRLRYLLSMILPVRVPSSMIYSDEDRCLPAVAPLRLQQFPQAAQVRVRPRQRVQDALVVAVVRPVVGFSKADVEHARLVLLQMRKGKAVGIRIVADAVPGRIRLKLQLAQLSDYPVRMVIGLKACVGSDGSGLVLHDPVYSFPGRKRGDPL